MSTKLTKHVMILLTTMLFITVLAACRRGTSTVETFSRDTWNEPFPEVVTVRIAAMEIANATFAEGEDQLDNLWTRRFLEEYNVQVETMWVSADYDLSMNLAIAAGELPDIFHVNAVQFAQLLEANLIEDITDAVNNYSSPGLRRLLDSEQAIFDTAKRDGRTYAVPQLHWGFITQAPVVWVRKDWYEEAGSPPINTVADLEALMETFARDQGAVFATTLHETLFNFWVSSSMWHANARGQGDGARMWVDDGAGGIIAAYETPEMLDAIAAWRRWYELGRIRQDFATADWDSMNAAVVSGETGIKFSLNWAPWGWQAIVEEAGPDSYMIALPLPTVDGTPARIPVHFANYAYNVVRRGFAHPEILPTLVSDYLYVVNEASLTGSIDEEALLTFGTNEMHHVTGPFRLTIPHYHDVRDVLGAMDAHQRGESFEFTSGGFAVLFFEEVLRWFDHRELVGFGRYAQMGHPNSSLAVGVRYVENGQIFNTRAWGPHPQAILDYGSITDSIIQEGITRIIMGVDPLEQWEVVLDDWRRAGGNTMTEAVNEAFGN